MRNSDFGTVGAQVAGLRAYRLRAHRRRGAQGSAPAQGAVGRVGGCTRAERARGGAACMVMRARGRLHAGGSAQAPSPAGLLGMALRGPYAVSHF